MKSTLEIARTLNSKVANLKDYQIYKSRFGVELREAANNAIENPIIGTASEIGERFGKYFPNPIIDWSSVADHEPDEKFVWAFHASFSKRKEIYLSPVGTI